MLQKHAVVMGLALSLALGACTREISFKQDVSPILSAECLSCHQPGSEGYTTSGFGVENYSAVMKGTKFGPVIVPGSHTGSTLILLLERKAHPSINMPKDRPPLSERQIEVVRQWIDQGAKNN